ncbi:DUF2336 domain-containing protein [Maricaulis sp. CAU 1757]
MSVVALRNQLTGEDIRRLVKGKDDEDRALAARKICRRMDSVELTRAERAAANDILRLIAGDAVELVRRALAVTLRQSPHLPADIAAQLIRDVDSIAVPLLAESPVLGDDLLIEVLAEESPEKRLAIAGRASLAGPVVQAIMDTGDSAAIGVAAANDGAEFDADAYQRAFSEFCDNPAIMDSFVARSSLPLAVTEKLIAHISDTALERLVRTHALPPQLAVELSEGARERAVIDLVDQAGLAHNPRHFVQQMRMNARLTPSLIVRALLRGHITFVEHAFAELAGLTHAKTWLLVHDAGPLGLRAVYDRTGMPSRLYPAIRAVFDIFHAMEMPHDGAGRERFRRSLAERAITRFQGLPEGDIDYILSRFDEDVPDLARAG